MFLVLPPENGGAVILRDPEKTKTPVNTGVYPQMTGHFGGHY
jgi:hypothetical protein